TSTTSPTAIWSSTSMKRPVMMSLTRLWLPKPIATPTMPAPARSGAISMPRCDKMVSPTNSVNTHSAAVRKSGSTVGRRRRAAAAEPAQIALDRRVENFPGGQRRREDQPDRQHLPCNIAAEAALQPGKGGDVPGRQHEEPGEAVDRGRGQPR